MHVCVRDTVFSNVWWRCQLAWCVLLWRWSANQSNRVWPACGST